MKGVKTYQDAYRRLQAILKLLESQEVAVDDLPKLVEESQQLLDYCRDRLRTTEKQLEDYFEEE
ncbi:MAG TPA: exodeoxyribonuclease VII small subunit [Saprospiraceae bacterium]|nr:exodeoxyribonuclease VII small subunit [Saprospiraceae bacterium]MCB9268997.1 exodeoxyribonuclease VII small subunit [Lewinellaceae bacterium]HPG08040.1 exodeoxyribonuclease VII small subunit [Saprospiraceae bacterium]HPR01012.1 exodeoxyribonuclease VII small subunit [Saprospiraceae bacterium]HQU53304.1 exodeoxyribonuclease VII small subunit [Saprospiraceae bacterium]